MGKIRRVRGGGCDECMKVGQGTCTQSKASIPNGMVPRKWKSPHSGTLHRARISSFRSGVASSPVLGVRGVDPSETAIMPTVRHLQDLLTVKLA